MTGLYVLRSHYCNTYARAVILKNRVPTKDLRSKDFAGRGRATLALLQFEFTQIA
jgi:hypothetical protein